MNVIELIPNETNTRFLIKMEYNFRIIAIIRNIEGRLYNTSTKQWSLPNQAYTLFMSNFDNLYQNSPNSKPKINLLDVENLKPEEYSIILYQDEADKMISTFSVKIEPQSYKLSQAVKNLEGFLRNFDSARNCYTFQLHDVSSVYDILEEMIKNDQYVKIQNNV